MVDLIRRGRVGAYVAYVEILGGEVGLGLGLGYLVIYPSIYFFGHNQACFLILQIENIFQAGPRRIVL